MAFAEIVSPRLWLRQWRSADAQAFASMNANAQVMAHFPRSLCREESDALLARLTAQNAQQDWGIWALERRGDGRLLGFAGLKPVSRELPFAPATEIAWRLAADAWGQGYAYEAAQAALEYGFATLNMPEIIAMTAVVNTRSRALMERLNMRRGDDFEHPQLAVGSPLRRHCLYTLAAPA
ncbi:GNAT family N-acetyltransferase [Spongiibacter marinus]|uniref:GNAT family N-acetyltransferase n=1 Tax=Spongiibacter marinus TaxID=354246 RepID=UPI0004049E15|nr:GNAT family N-acetyltransferase [Spongiibacter marinus]